MNELLSSHRTSILLRRTCFYTKLFKTKLKFHMSFHPASFQLFFSLLSFFFQQFPSNFIFVLGQKMAVATAFKLYLHVNPQLQFLVASEFSNLTKMHQNILVNLFILITFISIHMFWFLLVFWMLIWCVFFNQNLTISVRLSLRVFLGNDGWVVYAYSNIKFGWNH